MQVKTSIIQNYGKNKSRKNRAVVNCSCGFCEKCNLEKGICVHSNMARVPEHALGINMKKLKQEQKCH